MAAPLNLLTALSDQDMTDIHEAARLDPTLLQPPKLSIPQELARGMNDLTRFFGLTFGDPQALKAAAQTSEEFAQSENAALMGKLLPVLGESRARRSEDQRRAALEKERDGDLKEMDHIMENYGVLGPDGQLQPMTPEKASRVQRARKRFMANPDPTVGLDDPEVHDIRAVTPMQREKWAEDKAKQASIEAAARQDKSISAAADRVSTQQGAIEARQIARETKATEKAAAEKAAKDAETAKKESALKPDDVDRLLNAKLGITGNEGDKNINQKIAKAATPPELAKLARAVDELQARPNKSTDADEYIKALRASIKARILETSALGGVQRTFTGP